MLTVKYLILAKCGGYVYSIFLTSMHFYLSYKENFSVCSQSNLEFEVKRSYNSKTCKIMCCDICFITEV